MRWPSYWKDIVVKYHVVIEGWPHTEVPFRNLSDVSNLPKLELLLRGWRDGSIRFRRITEAQYQQMLADPSPWLGVVDSMEGGEQEEADS